MGGLARVRKDLPQGWMTVRMTAGFELLTGDFQIARRQFLLRGRRINIHPIRRRHDKPKNGAISRGGYEKTR
jgi:hypothetical protein